MAITIAAVVLIFLILSSDSVYELVVNLILVAAIIAAAFGSFGDEHNPLIKDAIQLIDGLPIWVSILGSAIALSITLALVVGTSLMGCVMLFEYPQTRKRARHA